MRIPQENQDEAAAAAPQQEESLLGDTDLTNPDEVGSLLAAWMDTARAWITDHGPGLIVKLVLFLVILFIFKILARVAGGLVRRAMDASRLKASNLLKNFFVNVVSKVTILAGLLIGLDVIGVPIGPLLAGVGVLGFVVGFALQNTLSNFAAGIMILLYRPYDVGDWVTAGGVTGKVTAMSLVSTTFLTPDNQVQVVPNGSIWGNVITNITANDTRRVDLVVGVSYDDDLDHAERVLMDEIRKHPKVLADPEPVVKCNKLGESSVDFVLRPWARTADYWDVYWDLTKSIKQRLDKEGLSIPYPQRDVHVTSQGGGASLPASG